MNGMSAQQSSSARRHVAGNVLRLFRVGRRGHSISELPKRTVEREGSLQRLMERHLFHLLDVHFVASEHPIGIRHEGRIDTAGIDDYGAPVVIEYKRTLSANLISQGLFYLDWLDEHRGEFRLLVQDRLGASVAGTIRWGGPRLICVASEFHRYDVRAVRQIKRRIEPVRYNGFGDDLLFLEKLTVPSP
jgi:hypothetical protein